MVRHVVKVDCGGLLSLKINTFDTDLSELVHRFSAQLGHLYVASSMEREVRIFSGIMTFRRNGYPVNAALLMRFIYLGCDDLVEANHGFRLLIYHLFELLHVIDSDYLRRFEHLRLEHYIARSLMRLESV